MNLYGTVVSLDSAELGKSLNPSRKSKRLFSCLHQDWSPKALFSDLYTPQSFFSPSHSPPHPTSSCLPGSLLFPLQRSLLCSLVQTISTEAWLWADELQELRVAELADVLCLSSPNMGPYSRSLYTMSPACLTHCWGVV